ncbi:hypothetical protein PV724_44545 [Streptomyces europaeiscabiei]|uniref:DNA polymerase III subunit beta family protein n=1 Tax=Streptomyces europaeiscabiei TaxID=146819 RepID=UPI0029AF596B|nr:hypothetical protein [Streptomyces europaeiscabiei]MDX3549548.1 hypothetical protein [Streptomyces europaeiscabiei]
MSVTINAHQLGRLIDKTSNHMGGERVEVLHGIRFDVDARYLHAVASDRYTFAVARYGLNHDDLDQKPFAALLPASHVRALREWLRTMKGAEQITLEVADGRLVFKADKTEVNVLVDTSLEFPDWRGILRTLTENTVDDQPFPCLNSSYLARFDTGDILRVRLTADMKAALLFGEDFIGAVMPARYAGLGPAEQESFATAFNAWHWTLAAGAKDTDMADLPKPESPRYEATKDVEETAEVLLRGVLRSTSNAFDTRHFDEDHEAWYAHIRAGVSDWMSYRYLDALYQVDPRAAQAVVTDTAEQLDSGEIGEWAWDAAEKAGHNPQKWHDDYEKALSSQAADKPPLWALKLAAGLNAAKNFGIGIRVDDNPHVVFDAEADEWKAVKTEPAKTTA